MRSIMGLTPPQRGRITWTGTDITGWAPYRVAQAGIGFVPEDRRIFADLTVWENLDVASKRSHTAPRSGHPRAPDAPHPLQWTIERVFDLFPKLGELARRNGGYLSGGEQQMLTIARTLMGNPALLLLDEPSEGLAPLVVEHLREQIARLKREGLTILLAEQNTEFSLALADRVYVLEKGSIRFSGPAARLRDDTALRHELLAL
jgi:branched-chain amino acid transport system ATP-binding protein